MRSILLLTLPCILWLALAGDKSGPTSAPSAPASQPSGVLEPVKDTTQPAVPEAQYREGTFLIEQPGRLTHNKKGEPVFVFDKDGKTQQLTLMANSNLAKMEDVVTGAASRTVFKITGMMTEYRGKNYLLVDRVVMLTPRKPEEPTGGR
jgi:hypothetical protein